MNSHAASRLAISIMAVLLGFTTFAQAGPPLICHPIENRASQVAALGRLDPPREYGL